MFFQSNFWLHFVIAMEREYVREFSRTIIDDYNLQYKLAMISLVGERGDEEEELIKEDDLEDEEQEAYESLKMEESKSYSRKYFDKALELTAHKMRYYQRQFNWTEIKFA